MDKLIVKIRINKKTGQKSVTIPKECGYLNSGDYVEIIKIV